jgi:hypothetical protein
MSKTRKQLIEDITNARKKSKENLLYIKGLSKMKKDELKKIDEQLQELLVNNDEENMDLDEEHKILKQTLITIGDETDDLEELDYDEDTDEEDHSKPDHSKPDHSTQTKPDHSKPDHSEPDHSKPDHSEPDHSKPDHSKPDHSKPNHSEHDHSEHDHSKPDENIIVTYEQEIKDMLDDLKHSINEELNEYRTLGDLRQGEIKAIYEHYDKLVDTLQFNVNEIKKELPEEQTISDTMYDDIDNTLDKVELRIKRFIEN